VPTSKSPAPHPSTSGKTAANSGKIRSFLRGLGHELEPVVHIGKTGLSAGVKLELEQALHAHELIKVRLLRECPIARSEAGQQLAACSSSEHIQTLGGVVLLYRARPKKPLIELPGTESSRSKVAKVPRKKTPGRNKGVKSARKSINLHSRPSGLKTRENRRSGPYNAGPRQGRRER